MGGEQHNWIVPDWEAPPRVRAVSTTRAGGVSPPPYDTLNLGDHVGDDVANVAANRQRLRQALGLAEEPCWLQQVHSDRVVQVEVAGVHKADGAFTTRARVVCAVMTADCLPILLCDQAGTRVGALHAGWRGLAAGIVESGVAALGGRAASLMAWLGPAIGPDRFEVGAEVREIFLRTDAGAAVAFTPSDSGRWMADLYGLARLRLQRCGVESIRGGGLCTYKDPQRFFSYRRDRVTGRAATMIWLESPDA